MVAPSDSTGQTGTRSSLWRNGDYMGWWTGSAISAFGTSVSTIAYPLLILYATGSVARAGVISAATMIGTLLTTLWGGALADRVSRKAIMIVGPLVQGGALAAAALLVRAGEIPIPALAGTAFASGAAAGITAGAVTPALRRIVPRDQVGDATGREMGRDMLARLVGTPLGGALFSVTRWFPFAADAVSFVFAALGAALIRRPLGPDRDGTARTGVLADVRRGFAFVAGAPFLRFVVVWGSLVNVIGQGFFLLFVALVKYRGGSPTTIGVVNAVALLGGIAGAVIGPAVLRRVRARLVLYAVMWIFVAGIGAVALVPRPWQIGLVLLVTMCALVPLNVIFETYVIRLVPDELSGRVAAVTRFGAQSLQWIGPLGVGLLADTYGVPHAVFVVMALMVLLAIAVHVSRSLGVLDGPAAEVEELPLPEAIRADTVTDTPAPTEATAEATTERPEEAGVR